MQATSYSKNIASSLLAMLALIMLLTASCKKEATPVADNNKPPFYSLPQGNHPYDNQIVDFNKQYGSFILYKFDKGDYTWNLTSSFNLYATQPDESKVPDAMSFLFDYIFANYSENSLKKLLPYKIILAGGMYTLNPNVSGGLDTLWTSPVLVTNGFNFVTLAVADTITKMTPDTKKLLRANFNFYLWKRALSQQAIEYPPGFTTLINYSGANPGTYRDYGMLGMFPLFTANQSWWTPVEDMLYYVREITSKTSVQFANTYLTTAADPKGLIRKKYDMITSYYKTRYGLDLQAMGDAQ
ncbi:MAG: hypothetical protein J7578_07615 [Chitinophagaceae bacterium]|nr:hypothetical protein [Chitinophagaceae bacterium]